MSITQSIIDAPSKVFTIADHLDCNDERSLFRGLQVVLHDGFDAVGGMMGEHMVRFIQDATEIAQVLNQNEAEDDLEQWWTVARVHEVLLGENRWEYDFTPLDA